MSELANKVKKSIERLKVFEPKEEPYWLAFSGGKDSVVCKALCDMAGVKYEAHYSVTSVDPPELVRFIRDQHPDVSRDIPRDKNGKAVTMWSLIQKKLMPPTRLVRYCCAELKERNGKGRMVITGVRWAESVRRSESHGLVTMMPSASARNAARENADFRITKLGGVVLTNDNDESRKLVEQCYRNQQTTLNPIIDWTDTGVWEFIRAENIPYCALYDEGWHRLGCIGCPMANTKCFCRLRASENSSA